MIDKQLARLFRILGDYLFDESKLVMGTNNEILAAFYKRHGTEITKGFVQETETV